MRVRCGILLIVLIAGGTVAPAHAQWVVTPYLGANISGDVERGKGGPGASVGYLGRRLGFEFDLQRYQHFFKDSEVFPLDPAAPPNCMPGVTGRCTDIDTDAMSFMGNTFVPIRFQRATKWRPYGAAGLGVIRAWTNEEDRHQNNLGFNAGGGLRYSLSDRIGLAGDLRYFRVLVDENERGGVLVKDYSFWRVGLGVTIGFPR
jgi:opacity protein-like surface antigen